MSDLRSLASRLSLRSTPDGPTIEVFGTLEVPPAIEHSLKAIREGFKSGLEPTLSEEGTSGSYILKNTIG